MSVADGPDRLAGETGSLLSTGNGDHSRPQPLRRSAWTQHSLDVYRAARATSPISEIYVLLVFIPLGLVARPLGWHTITVSIFNFLAIIPLSALVSFSADQLSNHVGELVGELVNATFGNAVELSVGILALGHGDIRFAQSAMLGSILSDILLILGCCLFSAACGEKLPKFNMAVADALSSLMIITAVALILPTALYSTFASSESKSTEKIMAFSRGSALVLLALYIMYLYFQLRTHSHLFLSAPIDESTTSEEGDHGHAAETQQALTLSPFAAGIVLIAAAVGIVMCTHLLLNSVDETAKFAHITKTFIAAVLIPIASNDPECASVIAASRSGKIDFAIGVIAGSILQIALFVIPFLVTLGWIIQQPMTLYFEKFQITILFLAVLVVNRLLQDGKYTYIQGAMLVGL